MRRIQSSTTCIIQQVKYVSAHRYHPSQCSRSWHRASRGCHPPPPNPGPWWRGHPEQIQTRADTHLGHKGQKRAENNTVKGQQEFNSERECHKQHFIESLIKLCPEIYTLCFKCCERMKYLVAWQVFKLNFADDGECVLTGLVHHKVFIDRKGSFNWAILRNLQLNLLHTFPDIVRRFTCNTLRVRIQLCVRVCAHNIHT